MKDRTLETYKNWAKYYDSDPNPHILLEHEDFLELVSAKRNEMILDAACGTGKYTSEIVKIKAHVVGIDFCNEMLDAARKKLPGVEFKKADIRKKLPFKNNRFDKIICGQTLKHVKILTPTFKEFYRILKHGGKFIFSVTHPEMVWDGYDTKIKSHGNLIASSDIFHHKFQDYIDAFNKSDFKIDTIRQVPINKKIKHLLTKRSYPVVKGRYEIIIFRLYK